jgi:hypothetical protein
MRKSTARATALGLSHPRSALGRCSIAALLWVPAADMPAAARAQNTPSPSPAAVNATPLAVPVSAAPVSPTRLPSTIPPSTILSDDSAAPAANPPAAAPKHPLHRRRARHTPQWVVRSRVQLALNADPRFKDVHASVTLPGVLVLEGEVFDDDARAAAGRTAAGVQGVTRVINALTTESLKWLLLQNRINQALQRGGFPLVSVKVIGKTAYISGQVNSDADRDRALALVNSTAPDITVGTNLIDVNSPGL